MRRAAAPFPSRAVAHQRLFPGMEDAGRMAAGRSSSPGHSGHKASSCIMQCAAGLALGAAAAIRGLDYALGAVLGTFHMTLTCQPAAAHQEQQLPGARCTALHIEQRDGGIFRDIIGTICQAPSVSKDVGSLSLWIWVHSPQEREPWVVWQQTSGSSCRGVGQGWLLWRPAEGLLLSDCCSAGGLMHV